MEVETLFVSRKTFGKYTGTLEWCVKDDVWIDNCFKSTVTDRAGNVIKIINRIRPIPEKIKPDHIVPPPIEGDPPIEGTGKLWYFDPRYLTDEYVFEPSLRNPVTTWVIKVGDDIFVYNAETGIKIGRNRTASGEFLCINDSTVGAARTAALTTNYFKQKLGVSGKFLVDPTNSEMGEAIKDNNVKYFYLLAHSVLAGFGGFSIRGKEYSYSDIENWMENRDPMKLAMLESCKIMTRGDVVRAFAKSVIKCEGTPPHIVCRPTITKGSVVVGLTVEGIMSIDWKSTFLETAAEPEKTWKDAFDMANATYPHEAPKVGFFGDENAKFVSPEETPEKRTVIFKSVPPDAERSVVSL